MEPQMTSNHCHRGFMLITVLIVTAIGLLFGAGALLLFRYQCQLRIDRQHELEKLCAVRSVLNFIRTSTPSTLGGRERDFSYYTGSGRKLQVIAKPVPPVFPALTNQHHMVMENESLGRIFRQRGADQYSSVPDYEYGADGVDVQSIGARHADGSCGLAFNDLEVTNRSARWWVNIGMTSTGGWLQEEYGRRYCFLPRSFVGMTACATGDVMRLCLIRNVTNENARVGCKHGWPLSQDGERALVFEVQPMTDEEGHVVAAKTLFEYVHTNGMVMAIQRYAYVDGRFQCPMGLQIAGDKVSLFYVDLEGMNDDYGDPKWFGYEFRPPHPQYIQMDPETYRYFRDERKIGLHRYAGVTKDVRGNVVSPELRAVFEVQTAATQRNESNVDFLTSFMVTPAYQYDVFIEHPQANTNRATVAQIQGKYVDGGYEHTVITYDTHGTENKGFRKDEREAERKRNGR